MQFIDKSKFDYGIVQDGTYFCIPASVLSILKYYDASIRESQFSLILKMILSVSDRLPSFRAAVKGIGRCYSAIYIIEQLTPNDFDEWLDNIKHELDNSCPIDIATRNSAGVHVRVVIGYNDSTKNLFLFNPAIKIENQIKINGSKKIIGANLIIESGEEDYPYKTALSDWNCQSPARDQLKITKI